MGHHGLRRMSRSTAVIVVTTALVALSGGAALAAGPPVVREAPLKFTDSHIEQEEHEDFCPDLDFDVLYTLEMTGGLFLGSRRGSGPLYFGQRFHLTETWENVENGRVFTARSSGSDRDQRVVDNGDGTLTITVQLTGGTTYYDSEGRRLFTDAGINRFTIVIDTAGTPDDVSDDEFVEFLGTDLDAGLRQTADRDFCADLQEFIG
jgi:hypothetical protein